MTKSIEITVELNGKPMTVCSEVDGYKPLGVEVYDEDGNEIEVDRKTYDMLYEKLCQEVTERMLDQGRS